jgi:glycosyltransferase involved in cell wall biosynthesis
MRETLARRLDLVLWVLLGALLILVLSEAWLNGVLLHAPSASGDRTVVPTTWPRTLKNALFIALAVGAAAKFSLAGRWRTVTTRADVAIVVLAVVFVVAGLVNDSSMPLIAKAIFVYLRGAIVFYAWRALDPRPRDVRRFLFVLSPFIAAHVVTAILQLAFGRPAYQFFGWTDTTWADINRAQGLFRHPNDLGHLLLLTALGLAAYLSVKPPKPVRWWLTFGVVALALAASQSRESLLATLAGLVVIGLVNRGRTKIVLTCAALVVVTAALPLVITPSNRSEWSRRITGAVNAVQAPSGQPSTGASPAPAGTGPAQPAPEVPPEEREIRILYARQAAHLWIKRPLLGYGTGQFGGYVAYQNNPHWNEDPRFGPGGFDLHGFYTETVDSFWLHLGMETGAIGALAYLAWMYLLCAPLIRARRRAGGDPPHVTVPWALAAVVAALLVAFLAISLEDPLFPTLLFTVLGFAWTLGLRQTPAVPRQRGPNARSTGNLGWPRADRDDDAGLRVGMVVVYEYEANPRVRREAEALAARGDDVTVLALNRRGAPREEMIDGVRVIHLPVSKYRGDSASAYLRLYGMFFIHALWWLGRRPRGFDIMHVHTMPEAIIFTTVAQKLAGVPVLLDIHDLSAQLFASKFRPSGFIMRGLQLSTRAAMAFATEIMTVHEPYAKIVRSMTRSPVTIVLNSPDERLFPAREPRRPAEDGELVFSYHGLIAPRHGLANLIDAIDRLRAELPRVRVQILGSGDGLDALREQVDRLGLAGVVSLPEELLPITEIPKALDRAGFGVLPSRLDPWTRWVLPTKLMEYMNLGIPVISFRNQVIAGHFPDDTITYVDPASTENLLVAMRELANDPDRAAKQAGRAKAAMAPLQWHEQKLIYLALIDRMVAGDPPTPRVITPVPRQRQGSDDSVRSPGAR